MGTDHTAAKRSFSIDALLSKDTNTTSTSPKGRISPAGSQGPRSPAMSSPRGSLSASPPMETEGGARRTGPPHGGMYRPHSPPDSTSTHSPPAHTSRFSPPTQQGGHGGQTHHMGGGLPSRMWPPMAGVSPRALPGMGIPHSAMTGLFPPGAHPALCGAFPPHMTASPHAQAAGLTGSAFHSPSDQALKLAHAHNLQLDWLARNAVYSCLPRMIDYSTGRLLINRFK